MESQSVNYKNGMASINFGLIIDTQLINFDNELKKIKKMLSKTK